MHATDAHSTACMPDLNVLYHRYITCRYRLLYKMWDPDRCVVIISPNVDFARTSASHPVVESQKNLDDLSDTFGSEGGTETTTQVGQENFIDVVEFYASEEESGDDILTEKVTSNEEIPNGINPGIPPIPREPDAPAHQPCCTEVEQLAETAGTLPH